MIESRKISRVAALDIFRAITMYLMLFVNDIPFLKEIPNWLLHASYGEDMLGFSDVIFPAFLFAMGMSIPFAIKNRVKKGDTFPEVCSHIFWRTIALLAMGVFTVNRDTIDATATGMSQPVFSLLMVLAFFLVWSVYPKVKGRKKYLIFWLKAIGVCIMLSLIYVYRGVGDATFSPQWWGILGLIGWTYLVCTLIFLVTRDHILFITVALLLMIACSVLSEYGFFKSWPLMNYVPSEATLHAFGMAGMWTGVIMQHIADKKHPRLFFTVLGISGVLMLVAAVISHQYWIISKIQATPTWLFFCCAIFFPLFGFVYWLTDVKGKSHWFNLIKPAGTVTLTCYIIPYAWYSMESLLHVEYPEWLLTGIPGLIKSAIYSLFVVGMAWLLMKIGVRLKI